MPISLRTKSDWSSNWSTDWSAGNISYYEQATEKYVTSDDIKNFTLNTERKFICLEYEKWVKLTISSAVSNMSM